MKNPFRYFKTPPEIIRLVVMMYVRFPLHGILRTGYDEGVPKSRHSPKGQNIRTACCAAADPWERPPLAAGAQDVHQTVHHFSYIDAPLAVTPFGRRYQRRNMSPFIIAHVTRVAKIAAIIGTTVF